MEHDALWVYHTLVPTPQVFERIVEKILEHWEQKKGLPQELRRWPMADEYDHAELFAPPLRKALRGDPTRCHGRLFRLLCDLTPPEDLSPWRALCLLPLDTIAIDELPEPGELSQGTCTNISYQKALGILRQIPLSEEYEEALVGLPSDPRAQLDAARLLAFFALEEEAPKEYKADGLSPEAQEWLEMARPTWDLQRLWSQMPGSLLEQQDDSSPHRDERLQALRDWIQDQGRNHGTIEQRMQL